MDTQPIERRSDPRRGVVVRVALALAAAGIMSAALDRRALAGTVPDAATAVAFGLALALLFLATFRRPVPGATWAALASVACVWLLTAIEVATTPLWMALYLAAMAAVAWRTAPHLRPLAVAAIALWTPALWLFGPASARAVLSAPLVTATLLSIAYTLAVIADPRRVHPSERLRRAGYGILAIAVAAASTARTLTVGPSFSINDVAALLAVVALVALPWAPVRPRLRDALAATAALGAFALLGLAYVLGTTYGADVVVAPHRAAELLVSGRQPYAAFDMPDALARFGLDPQLATHLEDGGVLRTYSYPALSFLLVAPFVWLGADDPRGLTDIRWVYLGVVLVIAAVAAGRLRPAWRPMAFAAVLGNEVIVRQSIIAGVDPAWALFTLIAWVARDRRWLSAISLGLAVADRQPAWLVAPFVLLAVARRGGSREAAIRGLIAVATALLVNAPFVLAAPERAIEGMFAPMLAPLVADGVGLMQFGVVDRYTTLLPRAAYTLVALALLAALLFAMWRRRDPASAPLVWPFIPLYFAARSLQNYFAFVAPFALVGDDELEEDAAVSPARPRAGPRT